MSIPRGQVRTRRFRHEVEEAVLVGVTRPTRWTTELRE